MDGQYGPIAFIIHNKYVSTLYLYTYIVHTCIIYYGLFKKNELFINDDTFKMLQLKGISCYPARAARAIDRGVHIICLWSKKIFESYFRDRLTFFKH